MTVLRAGLVSSLVSVLACASTPAGPAHAPAPVSSVVPAAAAEPDPAAPPEVSEVTADCPRAAALASAAIAAEASCLLSAYVRLR